MSRSYRHGETSLAVSAKRQGNEVVLDTEGGSQTWAWQQLSPGEYLLRRDGVLTRVVVAQDGTDRWLWVDGHAHHLQQETGAGGGHHAASGSLVSPMPGLVLKVFVKPGESVQDKQVLVVLEAMKMQYEITAPRDGVVAEVPVSEGQQVDGDVPLVVLEEDA